MFSDPFYEERLSVREWNMKLLLETVICTMHCRKCHLHNCNWDSHLHNYNKYCHPHICCRNCYLHKAIRFSTPSITSWRNLTVHCINELCDIIIISISNFLILIHFTNQKTLKPSLTQKLKLIFKFSMIMGQINIPLWTHIGHKGWKNFYKVLYHYFKTLRWI